MNIKNEMRKDVCKMINYSKSSHIGSALSIIDILYSLYFEVMDCSKIKDRSPDRDVFILSKGHASVGLYVTLAYAGIIDKKNLEQYYIDGGSLPGHLDMTTVAGIECSAGSLGHGPGIGLGMAIAKKRKGHGGRVFVLVGDGECNEGSVWEAIMLAGTLKQDNFTLIVDYNQLQGMGGNVINQNNLRERISNFGFNAVEIDGHDQSQITSALARTEGPVAIIARTIKGKGISYMENQFIWHYRSPNAEELNIALKELSK